MPCSSTCPKIEDKINDITEHDICTYLFFVSFHNFNGKIDNLLKSLHTAQLQNAIQLGGLFFTNISLDEYSTRELCVMAIRVVEFLNRGYKRFLPKN